MASPCSRMRLARGIQSVRSPITRCPTISKALQLSEPSFAATHRLGRPRRNVFNVDGVRDSRAMVSDRLNAVCMAFYFLGVPLIVMVVALLATYIPARRAA